MLCNIATMLCFLCKTILSQTQRHIIITTISLTSLQRFSLQNSWISLKYMSTTSNLQPFAVSYLINTLGFSPEKAASVSKYINFQTREKPDLIIEFFKKQGFSQTQMLSLIKSNPRLLLCDPQKTFLPKIEFLKSKGVLCSDLPKIIASSPRFLTSNLQKHIIPSFDFFMSLLKSEDKFIKALKRFSAILVHKSNVVRNIEVLIEVGVPKCNIVKLLERQPRGLTMKHERFQETVAEVNEMGFNALTGQFVMAVAVITCIGKSTWTRKADLYKGWGWSDDEILAAFGRFPILMALSEDKIEKTMDFFVNQMVIESSTIARYPALLSYSFHKRIVPRASVFQVLLSKGLVKQFAFRKIFYLSEEVFLEKFILCHGSEADELLKPYQAKMNVEQKKFMFGCCGCVPGAALWRYPGTPPNLRVLVNVLADLELWGIGVDLERCIQAHKWLVKRLKILEKEASKLAGMTFSLYMPADIAKVLYEHLKLPISDGCTKGKQHLSTDKHSLEALRHKHPIVPVIKEHRTLAKLLNCTLDSVGSKERDQTKRMVYVILYGMGAKSLAEQLDCTSDEAVEEIKNFRSSFPGVASWLQEAVATCRNRGYVETLKGRKRFLSKIKFGSESRAQRQAVNSICQE
ncbi:hypothetical protein L6164_001192 [Bauhinia variegata]|uniref:Uncharacterized protein n=1 Tax=Bauhinia variegata TaxID=167791 RepID=A0ACB9Q8X5_BAUVA|nr:hypothetical protein L6164_001192 [Bauhinia variegata]